MFVPHWKHRGSTVCYVGMSSSSIGVGRYIILMKLLHCILKTILLLLSGGEFKHAENFPSAKLPALFMSALIHRLGGV
jgi:hypothetical protein